MHCKLFFTVHICKNKHQHTNLCIFVFISIIFDSVSIIWLMRSSLILLHSSYFLSVSSIFISNELTWPCNASGVIFSCYDNLKRKFQNIYYVIYTLSCSFSVLSLLINSLSVAALTEDSCKVFFSNELVSSYKA